MIAHLDSSSSNSFETMKIARNIATCRMHIVRSGMGANGHTTYKVLLNMEADWADFSILTEIGLSITQVSILDFAQTGASNRQIAGLLKVSVGDVKYHLEEIGRKLDVSGKTAIIAQAILRAREIRLMSQLQRRLPDGRAAARRPRLPNGKKSFRSMP
ncbi:MAG: hypothetical protein HY975_03840 [Candidatus Kerfeldbacteria bacterium]|nr:hypothetical protein [Candidatus Kerfeldbacteria bacterium]